jgi:hypothetical protein
MTGYQSKKAAAQDKLTQPAQEPESECNPQDLCAGCRCKYVAQPAQESDEWFEGWRVQDFHDACKKPAQEHVATVQCIHGITIGYLEIMQPVGTKLYTTSPQRTWVGLTETRIKEIWLNGKDHGDDWADVLALARSFESELKELNT